MLKGGVNVCQRRLVNEVLRPLVTHEAGRNVKASTIGRRTAAIRYAHKLAGRLTRSVAESEGLTPNRSG